MVPICNGGGLLAVRQKDAVKFYKPNYPLKSPTPFVIFFRGVKCASITEPSCLLRRNLTKVLSTAAQKPPVGLQSVTAVASNTCQTYTINP